MQDYFLISSPLHLCLAASIALKHPGHERTAVFTYKDPKTSALYARALERCPDVFSRIVILGDENARGRWARQRVVYRQLEALFARPTEMRVFTGNDRRFDFQYAMHVATKAGARVQGIYIDDGASTYMGQRTMHRFHNRYIKPLLRKLEHGFWHKHAVTQGSSAWTTAAYVAFPSEVHPLLRGKELIEVDVSPLRSERFQAVVEGLTHDAAQLRRVLSGLRVVVTLPKERNYIDDDPLTYQRLWEQLRMHFDAAQIGIKAHPKSTRLDALEQLFPGSSKVDAGIGMEFLLTMLPDGCIVIGDISSTVLTSRWIRPDLPVIAMQPGTGMAANRRALYDKLRIPVTEVAGIGALVGRILQTPTP
ncbi:hypothetical protein [Azohydromonas sediminis]|uniref:hypothetical protein n=1 Tax=Azohydromonas sediminis TaxID=2259674 RepID=UPI000E65C759|nr:hypothetical protein [Azohydromonas sediminis]